MQETSISKSESRARAPVWGIGLTRTGTTSLNTALQILGYRSIHWPTTAALMYGELEAATDESVAAIFEFLDFRFPGSKFILTERDERDWIRSTADHRALWQKEGAGFSTRLRTALQRPSSNQDLSKHRAIEIAFTQMTLYGSMHFDERKYLDGYRRYHERVRSHFAGRSSDLLQLRICDGDDWTKICNFLGHPLPETPFPHRNASVKASSIAPVEHYNIKP